MNAAAPPLSGWARRAIAALAADAGSAALARLDGASLLVERAALKGYRVPGRVSAGGGCRLYSARDDLVALSLPRDDDRALLPALFGDASFPLTDDAAVAARIALEDAAPLVAKGRALGLAIARFSEAPTAPAVFVTARGPASPPRPRKGRVLDLSALWAGPLAGRLLATLGFAVVKVENRRRPDAMRTGDPRFFDALNQDKARVALDFDNPADRERFCALIEDADVVIESSRPRALLQFGIDADAIVRRRPVVWISVTAHGVDADGAAAIGFGDDCSVAGGLSRALCDATGRVAFAGDAAADPVTGIAAAVEAVRRWRNGESARVILSMAGLVAEAIAAARRDDPDEFADEFRCWAAATGALIASAESVRVARAC
ncbi:MAG: CoA transferase [Parvularculaceae bacterium]|nr:CoA transferase [Parvularculaceae bacterium]